LSGLSGLIGHLSGSALDLLSRSSGGLLTLTCNALPLVSHLAGAILHSLRSLTRNVL
jgi:hypothetical protein